MDLPVINTVLECQQIAVPEMKPCMDLSTIGLMYLLPSKPVYFNSVTYNRRILTNRYPYPIIHCPHYTYAKNNLLIVTGFFTQIY